MTDIAIEKPRLHTVDVTINGEQRSRSGRGAPAARALPARRRWA